ncbi:MAG: LuxR C-terminal-related transcriptional regulator [Novosphingobium sp.]|nr:LuxR C-terminal-related transcriptional regulator [Novosphingobium sp.]
MNEAPPGARPILPAHVRPPKRREGLLERTELVAKVANAALAKRLVLLSAASGFGKTTLLADVYRELFERGVPVLWLSVSEADRDPAWLSRILVEQLARLFHSDALTGEDFGTLANRLVRDEPVIVIIDNWHFIEAEATNRLFDRMLVETEGLANFVVASRSIPGFLFETFRLAGEFEGFTSRDLAFTTEEAGRVLQSATPITFPLFKLIERTEGWPAGVHLLRLALQQAGDSLTPLFDFSGSRTDVADYLGKAFFRFLPPERRAFLCNIAVLDQLSPDLVAVILDDPAAAATFTEVEHGNYFLAEAAEGSGRYRFHSMFRDFLLSQHPREATVPEVTVLARAESWHCDRDELEQAITYALRLNADERAIALLEDYAANRLQDEGKTFLFTGWVERLKRSGFPTTPLIDRWYCWSLVFSGRWRDALEFVRSHDGEADPEIIAIIAAFSDDQRTLRAAIEAWSAGGRQNNSFTTAVMECATAISAMAQGQIDAAVEAGHRARFANERSDSIFGRVWVLVICGFALLMKGQANKAENMLRDAIRSGERMLGSPAPVTRVARLMAAIIAWYRCADEQAILDLRTADLSPDEHGLPMIVVGAASVSRALGLEWTKRRVENDLISPAIALVRNAYRVEALLQRGDNAGKACEIARIFELQFERARADNHALVSDGWMLRDLHAGIRARLSLVNNDPEGALHVLNPAIMDCQRRGRGLAEQHLALIKVGALLRLGNRSSALRLLIQVAEQAVRGGMIRPFEGERRYIAPLLPALAEAGKRAPLGDPEAWRQFCSALRLGKNSEQGEREVPVLDEDIDPITDREREMLSFLDMGLSNQEIASRLGIGVPTVKWHLHNLFSKIRVRNRSSAVRFARENQLII